MGRILILVILSFVTMFTPVNADTPPIIYKFNAPLKKTSGRIISIPAASSTNDGYLSSSFYNTLSDNLLPSQTGHNGEALFTSGSTLYWSAAAGSGTVTNVQSTDGSINITNPTTVPNLAIKFPMVATTGGSAAAPAYAFGNSGMYASGFGSLELAAGGAKALGFDNNQEATFTKTVTATDFIYPAKSQNTFLAGPTSGSAVPSFRAIAPGDIGIEDIPFPLSGDGDAANPAYQTPSAGMYGISSGVLGFSTNGVERLRLENNGGVEIGNGSSGSLTVYGPVNATNGVFSGNVSGVDGNFSGNLSAANYPPPPPSGTANTPAAFDNTGALSSLPGWNIGVYGDLSSNNDVTPNNGGGGSFHSQQVNYKPLQNSAAESWNQNNFYANVDPDSSGFDFGTGGQAINLINGGFNHQGTSNTGSMNYAVFNSSIGNGTDPISIKGMGAVMSFNNMTSGVTIDGSLQGYGMQWNMASGSTLTQGVSSFFDNNNIQTEVHGYTLLGMGSNIGSIANNSTASIININPTIPTFTGNANLNMISLGGNYGTFGTGGATGLLYNANITSVADAWGLWVSMDNVNATNSKKAAYLDGDVEITGSLAFGGALSIGKLNAFGSQNPAVDGGGNPTSVHTLISQIVSAANTLTANADTIGLNTASLMTVSTGSTITSGPLGLGWAALGLPAVVETNTGGSIDYLGASLFALSLSGTSTGGTIDTAYGGRWTVIPNGVTTINNLKGVWFNLPFGSVATNQWGLYIEDAEKNYIEGELNVDGGVRLSTAGSQPTCDSAHRGLMWNVQGGTGVADQLQICQKDAADSYNWVNIP